MKQIILIFLFFASSCAPKQIDTKIKTNEVGEYDGAEITTTWVF